MRRILKPTPQSRLRDAKWKMDFALPFTASRDRASPAPTHAPPQPLRPKRFGRRRGGRSLSCLAGCTAVMSNRRRGPANKQPAAAAALAAMTLHALCDDRLNERARTFARREDANKTLPRLAGDLSAPTQGGNGREGWERNPPHNATHGNLEVRLRKLFVRAAGTWGRAARVSASSKQLPV